MKSRTEIPISNQLTPYLANLQDKQDRVLRLLLKKNNQLEFKQIKVVQKQTLKHKSQHLQLPQIQTSDLNDNKERKYRKYKNFYYSDQKSQQQECNLESRVQEILDKICHVRKKQINDLRPESNLMKRKGYSVDLPKQHPSILQQRQKSVQQNSFNYFLQPTQLNSESDWLEFVFG
ncbi:unnamed protein product [Paramecium primaurelia]|uniref:Uncharacterized protein n=1 Tax=Paramecium primaurelia TaxID=5886 RepID=A0A8S1KYW2_PARPR|nr:unnamed protein product [Paramecium primaurelia]